MENPKQKIATEILPYLNEMANANTYQIVASTSKEPAQQITFAELMELSLSELQTLQKIVDKAKTAKEAKDKANKYGSSFDKNYELTDTAEPSKPKFMC